MYNTDDVVNGVHTRDCFHSLLDTALEYQEAQSNKAEDYFNVIRECLGIDFSIIYDADADILFNIDCNSETESCFEVTNNSNLKNFKKAAHKEIDRIFDFIETMVSDGIFSQNYYSYLKSREYVLEDLIRYYSLYTQTLSFLNSLTFERVATNSGLKGKEKDEAKEILDILSKDEQNKFRKKINTLLKTQELLKSRLDEVKSKKLTKSA